MTPVRLSTGRRFFYRKSGFRNRAGFALMPPLEVAMAKAKSAEELRKEIERRAYLIWESEGRPDGRAAEHWARAEAEIRGSKPVKKVRAGKRGKAAAAKTKRAKAAPKQG
jgi:hypothetical protein